MSDSVNEILRLADEYMLQLPTAPAALVAPVGAEIGGWIDHTILKADARVGQIRQLCDEAVQYHFASVCVNPAYVPLCAEHLSGSDVLTCTVVGFPLGATLPVVKAAETRAVIAAGAQEVDMVINVGALKSADFALTLEDVQAVVDAAAGKAVVKVILEMCYLDQREKIIGCLICKQAGVDFVKTSTGFGPSGATVEDVRLMRSLVGAGMGVKAAGGIRSLQDARAMIEAGANRIGSSSGVSIVKEAML